MSRSQVTWPPLPHLAPTRPELRSTYLEELRRRYLNGDLDPKFHEKPIPDALIRDLYPQLFDGVQATA